MVGFGIGCGIGSLFTKDEQTRRGLLAIAGCLYVGQLAESLFSSQFSLLNNTFNQDEAQAQLEYYQNLEPVVSCSIKNYHFEMKEIKE